MAEKKNRFQSPFSIGNLTFHSNIFCSPLAGCSDLCFRQMVGKYRPGLTFCEMVKMDALIRNDSHTYRLLEYDTSMHPMGAQLCGSKPQLAGPCARIIEDLGFDLIDLNCGCPVDKVTKDDSGSGLLRFPELIGEILSNIIASVKIPVTVKIRAGWDSNSINAPHVTKVAEEAGAKVIFVHGRTREQGYKGPAIWEHIRQCKEVANEILVFGNGDIIDAQSAEEMFSQTGCDGLLLSRGTFGAPWIFEDMYRYFLGEEPLVRDGAFVKGEFLEHLHRIVSHQPDRRALLDLRRIGSWYFKKGGETKKLKEIIVRAKDLNEVVAAVQHYDW